MGRVRDVRYRKYDRTDENRLLEYKHPGKALLTEGTEVSFTGVRGRFRFRYAKELDSGVVEVTVFGGTKNTQAWRTFTADRIRTVHRKDKLR